MPRYITRRAWWDDEDGSNPGFSAIELRGMQIAVEDDQPEKTGLLDQHGDPLYRVRERIKTGFVP